MGAIVKDILHFGKGGQSLSDLDTASSLVVPAPPVSYTTFNIYYLTLKGGGIHIMNNKGIHMVAFLLLVVGGLNWLLVGLFQWDVGMLFGGQASLIARIVYVLVGLSALVMLLTHRKDCKTCDNKATM